MYDNNRLLNIAAIFNTGWPVNLWIVAVTTRFIKKAMTDLYEYVILTTAIITINLINIPIIPQNDYYLTYIVGEPLSFILIT